MSDAPDPSEAAAATDGSPSAARAALDRVRTEPGPHAVALGAALALGVVLAWVHWVGLVAAGALASLAAPTVRRGVGYALLAGVVVLAAFAVSLGSAAGAVPGMEPVVYVAVGAGLGLPLFGSIARAVVP
jgi:hypothetical protein